MMSGSASITAYQTVLNVVFGQPYEVLPQTIKLKGLIEYHIFFWLCFHKTDFGHYKLWSILL